MLGIILGLSTGVTAAPAPMAQAQIFQSGRIELAWAAVSPCEAAVGVSVAAFEPRPLDFASLPASPAPDTHNCSTLAGESYRGTFQNVKLKLALPTSSCRQGLFQVPAMLFHSRNNCHAA